VSDATTPGPSRIGQIAINVKDLNRAISFYRDVLGLTFLFQAPPSLAFFDCGGVRLMLSPPERPEHDHPASAIYYLVDDIENAYAGMVARGAESAGEPHMIAKMPDHDLWIGFINDTEGNLVGLMSEVRPPAVAN
jgi:methylmalonyl-CoA/ethylmalonyl-CoA epimerase